MSDAVSHCRRTNTPVEKTSDLRIRISHHVHPGSSFWPYDRNTSSKSPRRWSRVSSRGSGRIDWPRPGARVHRRATAAQRRVRDASAENLECRSAVRTSPRGSAPGARNKVSDMALVMLRASWRCSGAIFPAARAGLSARCFSTGETQVIRRNPSEKPETMVAHSTATGRAWRLQLMHMKQLIIVAQLVC